MNKKIILFAMYLFLMENSYSQATQTIESNLNTGNPIFQESSKIDITDSTKAIFSANCNILEICLQIKINELFSNKTKDSLVDKFQFREIIEQYSDGSIKSREYKIQNYNTGPKIAWYKDGRIKSYEEFYYSIDHFSDDLIPDSIIQIYCDTINNDTDLLEVVNHPNMKKDGISVFFNESGTVVLFQEYQMGQLIIQRNSFNKHYNNSK